MSTDDPVDRTSVELEELFRATVRLNGKVLGLIVGFVFGIGLFVATNWLLLKGGSLDAQGRQIIGPHLELLGQFLIGYRVSFLGSLIGLAYGLVLGSITGSLIAWVYNRVATRLE